MTEVFPLKVAASSTKLAYSNRVYVHKSAFEAMSRAARGSTQSDDPVVQISVGSLVFLASPSSEVQEQDDIALNVKQRNSGSFTLSQRVSVTLFLPNAQNSLATITILADLLGKQKTPAKVELDGEELSKSFKLQFANQVFSFRQQLVMDFMGTKLDLSIETFNGVIGKAPILGQILLATDITWKKSPKSDNNIVFLGTGGTAMRNDSLFRQDFNFADLGIGGLDEQFQKMFRTAFATRIFPGVVKQLGINHVRGILLYGPPGCGKTLIARQIGKVLNAREPKIVNGPEILDKFVGGSEEKVRALFADAEKEQAESGDNSMLHIIIFDEMDAIMKARGSQGASSSVSDSVVNQLLSKIDGVDSLNNILIIGMTNRKDLIDEAILRPGRLEIHIEVTLPDEGGRVQIMNIHTAGMKKSKRITQDAIDKIPLIAQMTKNYTGAEMAGLVRNAASFALSRNIDPQNLTSVDEKSIVVEWNDFERAVRDTTPAFGNKNNEEFQSCYRNGICHYGPGFDDLWGTLNRLLLQIKNSVRTPLMSVFLEGSVSSGKTAIAAKFAMDSDLPFVRMVSPDSMIGHSESQKCASLLKTFSDAYRSNLSIIFIDDIERIIEYTPVGHRFSNTVLQTLLILIKKIPPMHCRLMIIATTSVANLMEDLQLTQAFNIVLHVNQLQSPMDIQAVLDEYASVPPAQARAIAASIDKPIGIKQLLIVLEMARADGSDTITPENFLECLHNIGY